MAVTSAEELGKKIKSGESTIEIEGDLSRKVIKIKATGTVAWAIAVGAIGVAVLAITTTPATGPAGPTVSFFVAPAAVTALGGVSVTAAALAIAVAAGGVGALNSLYHDYKIKKVREDYIILYKP